MKTLRGKYQPRSPRSHRVGLHPAGLALGALLLAASRLPAAEPIPRVLPPAGIEVPGEQRAKLAADLEATRARLESVRGHALAADVGIFVKAVELALAFGEFYAPPDLSHAGELLALARERGKQLADGTTPWTRQRGRVVRGYQSRLDDSYQPYGLVIPDDVDFDRPVPLYVWLHGRGDKQTDLHFLRERMTRDGQIQPPGAIVVHPFGRHCLGFKSAGEIDVLEVIEHVRQQYPIDPRRIVLMGFSMGGAGTWHLGAHYTDQFVALSPGAGFAETAQYIQLRPENYPPGYEQKLWGLYDVPDYARNLLNRPVIAYSGEQDKQIQAARVMEAAFREHGQTLNHVIGPGMGHKYHPDSLQQILAQLAEHVTQGRPVLPRRVFLQTRTLRYSRMDWVMALRLGQHWHDARVDAEITGDRRLVVTTKNVTALRLSPWPSLAGAVIVIDGQSVTVPATTAAGPVELLRGEAWRMAAPGEWSTGLIKRPGLQGPIDDAFLDPFLVVLPTRGQAPDRVQAWLEAERAHFEERWRGVFRGQLRVKQDVDVTPEDLARFHLVAWGTPQTNDVLRRAWAAGGQTPAVKWTAGQITVAGRSWTTAEHVPVLICPNPLQPDKYLVVNSGPTFREAHDRTNSLQNPKLPDWAIIDVREPPSATAPGRVVAADFFNEHWR